MYFQDMALISANGTVHPLLTRESSVAMWAYGGGQTNLSYTPTVSTATADVTNAAQTTYYYHGDQIGSSRLMTSGGGWPVWQGTFLPYGEEYNAQIGTYNAQMNTNHYKFTGKERDDESGLDYFGARYYSNGLGRFITPDWAAKPAAVPYAVLGDPQTLNLYTYVRDIPTTQIDTDGHETLNANNNERGNTRIVPCETDECRAFDSKMSGSILGGFALVLTGGAASGPEAPLLARALYNLIYLTAPVTAPIIGGVVEGLAPGPSGTLTIATASRLTAQEISAGARYANQTGKALVQSAHVGEEFVDSAKKTYDVMQPGSSSFWTASNAKNFMDKVIYHVNKVDKTIIDLKGASKAQIKEIKGFVNTLTKEQQKKIDYVK